MSLAATAALIAVVVLAMLMAFIIWRSRRAASKVAGKGRPPKPPTGSDPPQP